MVSWLSAKYDDKHKESVAGSNNDVPKAVAVINSNENSRLDDGGNVVLAHYGGGPQLTSVGSITGARSSEEKRVRKKSFMQVAAAASAAAGHSLVLPRPDKPRHIVWLYFFHFFSGIAILAALSLLLAQWIPFFLVSYSEYIAAFGYETLALKIYNSVFFVLFTLTEYDLQIPFIQSSFVLQEFVTRGFVYSYFGLKSIDEGRSDEMAKVLEIAGVEVDENGDGIVDERDGIVLFMMTASYSMLAMGLSYMMFGCCCCQRWRDGMKEAEKEAWEDYRELLAEWKELRR